MTKSSQRKFTGFTAIIIILVLAVIFGAICIIMNEGTVRSLLNTINDTEYIYSSQENPTPPPHSLYAEIYENSSTDEIVISKKSYDQKSFKNVDINTLIIEICKENNTSYGNIDGVYYKLKHDGNGIIKLYAVDSTFSFQIYKNYIGKSVIVLSVIAVLLILLAYILSSAVFKPIMDNFEKQKVFISNASHELKTPLAIINASVDVLKAQDKNNKWLNNISSQSNRMNVLITDMLSLSKIEEGQIKLTKEDFDLSNEIINCVLPFEAMVYEKKKRIIYDVQEGIRVNTDRNSVKMLINILLDNAVKYAKDKSAIKVSLKKVKNKTIFTVFNSGSNVPNKDSNRVFERFYRADESRSRDSGGSGLGLAIAKNLATINKWKISAKSQYQESMTITVII